MNSRIGSVLGLVMVSILRTGFAEYRVWTDADGKQLEAEFVRVVDEKVVLLKRDGSELKVSLDTLSMADRKYAVVQAPPRIEIKVSTDTDRENKTVDDRRGPGLQIQKESIQLEIFIRKTSAAPYEAPLVSTVYLMGKSAQRDGYVLLERTQSKFRFTTGTKNQHTYSSAKARLQQLEAGKQVGVEYQGYLVVVKDRTGTVLEMKCSKLDFEKNSKTIMDAQPGAVFDKDFNPVDMDKAKRGKDLKVAPLNRQFPGRRF